MRKSSSSFGTLGNAVLRRVRRRAKDYKLGIRTLCRIAMKSKKYAQTSRSSFIKSSFNKRECHQFIPSVVDPRRCGCGKSLSSHEVAIGRRHSGRKVSSSSWTNVNFGCDDIWQASRHSVPSPTDAFGMIEFQGGSHPIKAQYVRLSYETSPEKVLNLLLHEWKLELPKLLMSIHGGKANFVLQPKLKKVIQDGLLKAAKTTGAWIFTGGTNSGVIKHVGEAFNNERSQTLRGHVVTIGIAPWGIIENREDLIGENLTVPYQNICSLKSKFAMLNNRHAYFLLVDDGTVAKYGSEIAFRKKLEKHISKQTIFSSQPSRFNSVYLNGSTSGLRTPTPEHKPYGIPIVGVIIEGGADTIRTVLEYVTDTPPIPVVVCDGSGRAADLLAFTHKYVHDGKTLPDHLKDNFLTKIEYTFNCCRKEADSLLEELIQCVKRKELITIFRMGEEPVLELDQAILTCLLKGSRLSAQDQLSLALTWNRVDIARCEVFIYGQEWTNEMLEQAMMDALTCDSVDFVQLLLENGLNMGRFLTMSRLEELYNTKRGPTNTLGYLIMDVTKRLTSNRVTLLEIGLVIEKLMGGAYQSRYRSREFRTRYESIKKAENNNHCETNLSNDSGNKIPDDFACPYNELLIWAVLMKRQQMALFMFQREEEAIAKALIAIKLYKSMAHEAAQDDLEAEISENFRKCSQEFEELALELLDYSYRQNDFVAQQMLTYELVNWGNQTCLTLAVSANHIQLLAHPCCQILLADLWMGGIRTRKSTNLKVLLGLLCPPFILTLEFKSKEELKLMPQTEEEHNNMENKRLDEEKEDESEGNSSVVDIETGGSRQRICPESETRASKRSIKTHIRKTSLRTHDKAKGKKFKHERPLRLGKKIYEFYTAPLTKFLGYTITYFFFLCVYSFDVLTIMYPKPDWSEMYCLIYITTLTIEKMREIAVAEPVRLNQKILIWLDNKWNPCDMVAIVLYISAFAVRFWPSQMDVAKVIYACDIMYWYMRILHLLSVNKYFGPFVTMIGKMVINMVYFVVLLLVVLVAFGVCRQAILSPYESPNWNLARNVFFHPYFMLYGEVYADSISPPCGEGPDLTPCRTGRWVTVIAMCLFLLIANILLINLLIAVFNNIYLNVDAVAQQVWKSKRYSVIMEYEQKPVFPPPLIIINHIYMLYQFIRKRCSEPTQRNSHVLKLFLTDCELEAIHDFEEECVDGYIRERRTIINSSSAELVKANNGRVELLTQRVEDLYQRSLTHSSAIQSLKFGIRDMTMEMKKVSGYLAVIHRYMSVQSPIMDQSPDDEDLIAGAGGSGHTGHGSFGDCQEIHSDEEILNEERYEDDSLIEAVNREGHGGSTMDSIHEESIYALNELILPQATLFYKKMQSKKQRSRRTSNAVSLNQPAAQFNSRSAPSSVDDYSISNGNQLCRRRLNHRNSECSESAENESKAASVAPLIVPEISTTFMADANSLAASVLPTTAMSNLLHDYTSITDEIESQQLFQEHSITASRLNAPEPNEASPAGPNKVYKRTRRHSDAGLIWKSVAAGDVAMEQAILAKEEQLLEAERQDYLRLEKVVENRLRRSDNSIVRKDTSQIEVMHASGGSVRSEETADGAQSGSRRRALSLNADYISQPLKNLESLEERANVNSSKTVGPVESARYDESCPTLEENSDDDEEEASDEYQMKS